MLAITTSSSISVNDDLRFMLSPRRVFGPQIHTSLFPTKHTKQHESFVFFVCFVG